MKLHELSPAKGSTQSRKRVGRGPGSGLGKTSGKGHKGQKSRASYRRLAGFEGGQMTLVRRVPKRGFNNVFRVEYEVVNVGQLAGFEGEITPEKLVAAGLVKRGRPVKVLGDGEATKGMSVVAHKFSKTAKSKIEAAGGRCQEPGA